MTQFSAYFSLEKIIKTKTKDKDLTREELISEFTDGKFESLRDLEAAGLYSVFLSYLKKRFQIDMKTDWKNTPENQLRRKIFSLCREIGFISGTTPAERQINALKIDVFLQNRGAVKKPLNELRYRELQKVIKQLHGVRGNQQKTRFNQELDQLLKSLNISNDH